jgi:hypothetical protein
MVHNSSTSSQKNQIVKKIKDKFPTRREANQRIRSDNGDKNSLPITLSCMGLPWLVDDAHDSHALRLDEVFERFHDEQSGVGILNDKKSMNEFVFKHKYQVKQESMLYTQRHLPNHSLAHPRRASKDSPSIQDQCLLVCVHLH